MSESTVSMASEVVEATQRAIAFLVNENAELRAELSWFRENPAEPVGVDEPVPYEVVEPEVGPRVFQFGDTIPDDVKIVEAQPWSFDDTECFAFRGGGGGWEFATREDAIKLVGSGVESGGFENFTEDDYPLTEVIIPQEEPQNATYTLREAAELLNQEGIDTGQNRLKDFLNNGICWTDHYGTPREVADEFLVLADRANPTRDAVVRVTPLGVSELARVMKLAI